MKTLDEFFSEVRGKIKKSAGNNGEKVLYGYELPEDWEIAKFRNVLEEVDIRVKEVCKSENLPILSLTKNFGLIPQDQRFKKRVATEDVSNYKIVKKGWLVYNPYVIWEGAICTLTNMDMGIVSPVYVTWKPKQNIHYLFLEYIVKTQEILNEFLRFSSGAVNRRRSIKKRDFLNIAIPLSPLEEQKKIAYVLRLIQRAIEQQDKIIETTKELKKSLMKQLFTKGLDPNQPTKMTEIGEVPAHWEVIEFRDVLLETQYGLSIKGNPEFGKYPILRMNNIVDGRITTEDLQFVDLDDKTFKKFKLRKGDLLFNRTNSIDLVGKTAIFDLEGDFVFASYLIRLRLNENKVNPYFINYYINWDKTQIRLKSLASKGVSQANISATKLKTLKIILPPLEEQKQIAQILQTVDKKIEIAQKKKERLQELFKTMLHKLMTAQIRVKDLEIPVEKLETLSLT